MLPDRLRILYLHGFASSPASRKAQFFAHRLQVDGFRLEIPDLADGSFERLTISQQLRVIGRLLAGEPATLIGSSLGGYLAALYAANHPEIERLILLAPAFDFPQLWQASLGPDGIAEWRRNRTKLVFHHGEQREMPLDFEFLEDAIRFPAFPHFAQPALLFHGERDPVVPVGHSALFAAAHPNVRFQRLDSAHELTDVLDEIWLAARDFLVDRTPVRK
jgi:uncharacterized protein